MLGIFKDLKNYLAVRKEFHTIAEGENGVALGFDVSRIGVLYTFLNVENYSEDVPVSELLDIKLKPIHSELENRNMFDIIIPQTIFMGDNLEKQEKRYLVKFIPTFPRWTFGNFAWLVFDIVVLYFVFLYKQDIFQYILQLFK